MTKRLIAWGLTALVLAMPAAAQSPDYGLKAEAVGEGAYVFIGSTDDFSPANGGNIVNTGFIVTDDGVVVIDTGPSARYGREMRAAIARVTDKPIVRVFDTHMHPDHFLGNQGYETVTAEQKTIDGIARNGADFTTNMYRMVGDRMRGTEPVTPQRKLDQGEEVIGGHHLRYLSLQGHTEADLVIFDETSGVLFASDIVFYQRTPTTPHASVAVWLDALAALERLPFKTLVPGHGPVTTDNRAIEQTRAYLIWLDRTLHEAASAGLDMTEVMQLPIPAEFQALSLAREEFQRSVVHLYPRIENGQLPQVRPK